PSPLARQSRAIHPSTRRVARPDPIGSPTMQPRFVVIRSFVLSVLVACAPHPGPASQEAPREIEERAPPPAPAPALPEVPTTAAERQAGCADDGEPYDPGALRERVAHLASAELDGRAPGSPGDGAARAYLAD